MIEAIAKGVDDLQLLGRLAKGLLKNKQGQLKRALRGLIGKHLWMLLLARLKHIEFLNRQIAQLDREIEERMGPFEEVLL